MLLMRKQACRLFKCDVTYRAMIRHNPITMYWFLCVHIPTNIVLYDVFPPISNEICIIFAEN